MSGSIAGVLLYAVGLLIFYGIIRKAVAHGMWDAWERRAKQERSERL